MQGSLVAAHLCDACGIPGVITREPASRGVIGEGTADEHGVGGRGLVGQPDPPVILNASTVGFLDILNKKIVGFSL